jgi:hypothetical protein
VAFCVEPWVARVKDEDPVDALDTEVTKIIKKLAEARKGALAQLTLGRSKKAVAQPDEVATGSKNVRVPWKGVESSQQP